MIPPLPACYDAGTGEQSAAGLAVLDRVRADLAAHGNAAAVAVVDDEAAQIAKRYDEEEE